MAILFDQGAGLLKKIRVGQEWKPKLWSRVVDFFSLKKNQDIDKILAVRLEGLFGHKIK